MYLPADRTGYVFCTGRQKRQQRHAANNKLHHFFPFIIHPPHQQIKKQAFASLLCFFDRAGTEPFITQSYPFFRNRFAGRPPISGYPHCHFAMGESHLFSQAGKLVPQQIFPFNCVVSKLCSPKPFLSENHDSTSFVTVSTKFGEIPCLFSPAAKFPRPHQKRRPRFPPRCKAKVIPNQSGFSPLFKSFRLESPLERILVKQSFSKI